jgi:DnaJ-class molecular chaperone
MPKNYYLILGIRANAPLDDVKGAYRRLAKEYRPDRSGKGASAFLAVQEAYSVLSDPVRRGRYDRSVQESRARRAREFPEPRPARQEEEIEPLIPEQRPVNLGAASLTRSFHSYRPGLEELFDRIWSNFTLRTRPKSETLQNLTAVIHVTPEQAFHGGHVRIGVPAQLRCPTCWGRGGAGPYECWRCGGEGVLTGEYPLLIHFPAAVPDNYAIQVPLDRFGIYNLHLTVAFRVTEQI